MVARMEGRGAVQPLNATSHWLHGDRAASVVDGDAEHTAVGFATHYSATLFWAIIFEAWQGARPTRDPQRVLGRAAAVSVLAATVDYTITPKRFTPGWELVLSKRSMSLVYASLAAGLATAALLR